MSVTSRLVKCCSLLLLLDACGADANVVIQLVGLGSEDPYAGVASLEVTASLNDRVLSRERTDFDGQPIELDPLEARSNMVLRVAGLDDADGLISRGLARPVLPDGGDTCCVLMCFCTVAVFDTGDCSCGSDACAPDCFE